MTPVPVGAQCAWHPNVPALTICARCGSFACSSCQTWDSTGRLVCLSCSTLEAPLATRGSRFLANLLDQLIFMAPIILVAMVAAGVAATTKNEMAFLAVYPGMALGLLIGGGLQIYSQVTTGQSLGKRALNIKVVRLDGSAVDIWRLILLRNVILVFAAQLCGFVGLVDALFIFSAEQRCLHDLIADTKVVVAMKSS